MLLRNNNYKIVKSNKKAPFSHYPVTWMIEEDRLKETNLNSKSKELELSIIEWLNNHNDEATNQARNKMALIFLPIFHR